MTHRQVRVTNQVPTITNQKRNYAVQAELLTVGGTHQSEPEPYQPVVDTYWAGADTHG